jgi:hypothetical protein
MNEFYFTGAELYPFLQRQTASEKTQPEKAEKEALNEPAIEPAQDNKISIFAVIGIIVTGIVILNLANK